MSFQVNYLIINDTISATKIRQITLQVITTGSNVLDNYLGITSTFPWTQTITVPITATSLQVRQQCRQFIQTTMASIINEINQQQTVGTRDQVNV